ncbi:MAG: phosphatidate cytidylyltransferase [Albidovulum sp.]
MTDPAKWDDLRLRIMSAVVVLVLGFGAVWAGGLAVRLLSIVVAGLMIWELARLSAPMRPGQAVAFGALAMGCLAPVLILHGPYWLGLTAVPAVLGVLTPRKDRLVFAVYAMALMLACYAFTAFREGYGLGFTVWLVLVVVASDVLGYFGGRILGGPKFWPRFSPKKTWSGTVMGWIGAAIVGLVAAVWAGGTLFLMVFSALTAFAAQMGDIAESAMKRRAGIKDSSGLIPGHGGFLDRFDGLIGAAVLVLCWGLAGLPLPDFGG